MFTCFPKKGIGSLGEIKEEKKGKGIVKLHGFMEWNRCSFFHLV
jgi:hypothetical protein